MVCVRMKMLKGENKLNSKSHQEQKQLCRYPDKRVCLETVPNCNPI